MRKITALVVAAASLLMPPVVIGQTAAARPQAAVGAAPLTSTSYQSTILGTAMARNGETLPYVRVRARNVVSGTVPGASSTRTSSTGQFTIANLPPGQYVIEIVDDDGAIVGASRLMSVAAGSQTATTVTAVTGTRAAAAAAAEMEKFALSRPRTGVGTVTPNANQGPRGIGTAATPPAVTPPATRIATTAASQTVIGASVVNPEQAAISGTAVTPTGEALGNTLVRARNLLTGVIGGSTTTSSTGEYTIVNLPPGQYVVEIVDDEGQIIGTSAFISAAAGTVVAASVTATTGALTVVSTAAGLATTLTTAAAETVKFAAAAAGVAGMVAPPEVPIASPSR